MAGHGDLVEFFMMRLVRRANDIAETQHGRKRFAKFSRESLHSLLGLFFEPGEIRDRCAQGFTELLDLFRLERRTWTIRPYEPLPDLGRKFDLITAFSIDFNRESKREWWWGPPEWAFFLDDLKRHLNPGGRIFLGLNPRRDGEYYTAELREFFLNRSASVERENVAFPPN